MRYLVLAVVVLGGCSVDAVPAQQQETCAAVQTSPATVKASASGPRCTPPSFDNVHVEVDAENYRIIIVSADGFATGVHSVQVSVDNGPMMSGSATSELTDTGWTISSQSVSSSLDQVTATVSGD